MGGAVVGQHGLALVCLVAHTVIRRFAHAHDRETVGPMLDLPGQSTSRPFPRLTGRVSDLQARVLEHTAHRLTPDELAAALRRDGLDAHTDDSSPGDETLVRVLDDDVSLLFDAATGALAIVDVRRRAAAR